MEEILQQLADTHGTDLIVMSEADWDRIKKLVPEQARKGELSDIFITPLTIDLPDDEDF